MVWDEREKNHYLIKTNIILTSKATFWDVNDLRLYHNNEMLNYLLPRAFLSKCGELQFDCNIN